MDSGLGKDVGICAGQMVSNESCEGVDRSKAVDVGASPGYFVR